MSDILSAEQRHRNMAAIRSSSTRPEMKLRKTLWHLGFRYRVNDRNLSGSPDIVLPKHKTVIFINGCFWHGHKDCKYYTVPKTNTDFWVSKVARNRDRDQEKWRQLEAIGWRVIIVWECELKKPNLEKTVDRVVAEIRRNRDAYCAEQEERKKARAEYHRNQKDKKEKEIALLREVKSLQ